MRSKIYLDYNATAPLRSSARDVMLRYLGDQDANPSSLYLEAEQVRGDIDGARRQIASCLGVRPGEVFFTSGATESVNWAIRGVLAANPKKKKFVTTRVEHSVSLDIAKRLRSQGYEIVLLSVDELGALDSNELMNAIDDETAIVSLVWANNETGVEFDVEAIGELCRSKGAVFHVDAAQKAGKGMPSLGDLPIDLLSFSGHKFGGPKGTGVLYIDRGVGVRPLIWGGKHETGRRAGTENVPGILGMSTALLEAHDSWQETGPRIQALRNQLEAGLLQALPDLRVNGDTKRRNENTLSVCYPGIEGHGVVLTLSQRGLACASGSACTAQDEGPSHVLEAMDVPGNFIHGALRFSLGCETTAEDIVQAEKLIIESVKFVTRI